MPVSRKRSRVSSRKAFFTAAKTRTLGSLGRARKVRSTYKRNVRARTGGLVNKVNTLYKMIETKNITRRTSPNVGYGHNLVSSIADQLGGNLNMFKSANGTDDPMGVGGSRIGDQIAIKGVSVTAFFENSLSRPKVFYRLLLIKSAKGDAPGNNNLFRGDSDNKMLDMINTERFSIVVERKFNITSSSDAPSSVALNGEPGAGAGVRPGQGTKIVKFWIPGYKFGKRGILQFENNSQTQTKFYDYTWMLLVYDWYGTPTLADPLAVHVGRINEMFTKVYFKDA